MLCSQLVSNVRHKKNTRVRTGRGDYKQNMFYLFKNARADTGRRSICGSPAHVLPGRNAKGNQGASGTGAYVASVFV